MPLLYNRGMKMIIMGSGTSHGVPVIGCNCKVCASSDERDKRSRCSAYLTEPVSLVIDTGPDFRMQALKFQIKKLDALLITHSHADHLNGLDDVRVFSHTKAVDSALPAEKNVESVPLDIYANSNTIIDIKNRFDYIFTPVKEGGGKPKVNLIDTASFSEKNPIVLKNNGEEIYVFPIPLLHGTLNDCGFLLCQNQGEKRHSIAYLTDCSSIAESSIDLIKNNCGRLDHLVIDGLRVREHSTHFSFEQALAVAEKLLARHTWLTHMTHDLSHKEIQDYIDRELLPKFEGLCTLVALGGSVAPAYDGLVIES